MNITKEILEWLKVSSIAIRKDGADIMSFLTRFTSEIWTLTMLQKHDFLQNEKISVQINFTDGESEEFIGTVIESGEDFCDIRISGSEKKEKTAAFISALENLDEKYIKYGRRKEERIEIGKRNSEKFGLSSPEQTVFVNGIKMQQPCAVVDASIHGICIITPCTDQRMKDCDSFNVMLNFVNPEQTIVLKCHKVHAQLKKTESKIYARISCQLLEPIHFAWKERVIKLLESEKNL